MLLVVAKVKKIALLNFPKVKTWFPNHLSPPSPTRVAVKPTVESAIVKSTIVIVSSQEESCICLILSVSISGSLHQQNINYNETYTIVEYKDKC